MTGFPPPGSGPLLVIDPTGGWRSTAVAAGWQVHDGDLPVAPWSLDGVIVCTADPATAALALARRAGAVAAGGAPSGFDPSVVADARRIGAAIWPDPYAEPEPEPVRVVAVDDTAVLMDALLGGVSVRDAARAANMSVRTAQRRLDSLRKRFGVATTAGVVAAWSRERSTPSIAADTPTEEAGR